MKKIAIVDGFIRDAQIYTGDPEKIGDETDWESEYADLNNAVLYIGIFESLVLQ